MRLACTTYQYEAGRRPLDEALRDIAGIGYRGVEITLGDHYPPQVVLSGSAARKALEETGLAVASLSTSLFWAGPPEQIAHNRETFTAMLAAAGDLGTDRIVAVTGPWMEDPDPRTWEQIAANLRWVAEAAAQAAISVCLEAVAYPWPRHPWPVHNVETFLRMREAVGSALLANVDPSNYLAGGDDPVEALHRLRPYLLGVHLKDSRIEQGRCLYTPMGEGEVDFDRFLRTLKDFGYDGWLVVEYEGFLNGFHDDPTRAASESLRYLVPLLERVLAG